MEQANDELTRLRAENAKMRTAIQWVANIIAEHDATATKLGYETVAQHTGFDFVPLLQQALSRK